MTSTLWGLDEVMDRPRTPHTSVMAQLFLTFGWSVRSLGSPKLSMLLIFQCSCCPPVGPNTQEPMDQELISVQMEEEYRLPPEVKALSPLKSEEHEEDPDEAVESLPPRIQRPPRQLITEC